MSILQNTTLRLFRHNFVSERGRRSILRLEVTVTSQDNKFNDYLSPPEQQAATRTETPS